MTALRSRSAAALVLIISLVACKKDVESPHALNGVPLLAHVPADTPYLMAALESIPPELWAWGKQSFEPMARALWTDMQKKKGKDPVLDAIVVELDGKWSQAGIESLGFSTQPRFVIYGLDLQPVVARLAVKDDKLVRATIERIAARAGKTLPAMATKDGRSYWRHADRDGTTAVIALASNELVFAIGTGPAIDAKLGLILGSEQPAQNLADGALVKQLMTSHGFGGQLIAFADTRRIATTAFQAVGATPGPACTSAVDQLTAKVPRIVFGYGEMTAAKISAGFVAELSPDAVAALRAIRTEVPGIAAALAEPSLFSVGGGVDLLKAQQLGVAVAASFRQLGNACAVAALSEGAAQVSRALGQPLPEPFGRISGAALIADDVVFSPGPDAKPEKVDGIALIGSPDARALFNKTLELQPMLAILGITVDGKLHPVTIPMPLPFAMSAGIGDRLVVVTAGDKRKASAEKLLAARDTGKLPLLQVSYDSSRLIALGIKAGSFDKLEDSGMRTMLDRVGQLFGRLSAALEVTDHGLGYWGAIELKPQPAAQQAR